MPPFIFSASTQPPTDLSAEDRWRRYTYLEYLRGVPEDAYQWSLSFVQTCRFAWRLPPEFEFFAGRVASLGIDRLELAPAKVIEILRAVAGEGARIPGTPVKLRVARPWLVVVEQGIADEPWLPSHWLEGLELHGEPLSIWIGKRVPAAPICPNLFDSNSNSVREARKQYADLDWSLYQSTQFGWKLRQSPPLPSFFYP
jgi:hypothetical protein